MKPLLALLVLALAGCSNVPASKRLMTLREDIGALLPDGQWATINATLTGKFSSTTISGKDVVKSGDSLTAGELHIRHSNPYIPLIQIDTTGYVPLTPHQSRQADGYRTIPMTNPPEPAAQPREADATPQAMIPVIRASEMDRILRCPGSRTIVALVDAREGDEGDEGKFLHWMIANRLIREAGAIGPEGGLPPPDVPEGYAPPQNSLWIADWAVRHVYETIHPNWALMVESGIAYNLGRWIGSGHLDILAISPDGKRVYGKDWKTGLTPVDSAEVNDQVLTYAVLCKRAYPDVEEIEFEICQPRVSEDDGFQRVSRVVIAGDVLGRAEAALNARVCEALDQSMVLETGIRQCKWCAGCSCPAIQTEQKQMKMTLTPDLLAQIKRTPDDRTLGDFVLIGRMLAKPTDDAEKLLHARLDTKPEVVAGSGVTITRRIQKGGYDVPDPVAFLAKVHEFLPSDESIARTFSPSMSRIKDEIADKLAIPKTAKDGPSAEGIFDVHLRPLVEQRERRILDFKAP